MALVTSYLVGSNTSIPHWHVALGLNFVSNPRIDSDANEHLP